MVDLVDEVLTPDFLRKTDFKNPMEVFHELVKELPPDDWVGIALKSIAAAHVAHRARADSKLVLNTLAMGVEALMELYPSPTKDAWIKAVSQMAGPLKETYPSDIEEIDEIMRKCTPELENLDVS